MVRAPSAGSSALSRSGRIANRFQLSTSYGSEATTDNSLLGFLKLGKWSGLVSGQVLGTDGYILIAPNVRGPIDQPNNVHAQNGLTEFDHGLSHAGRIFLRGSVLNEDRHNGTPIQINSTRLWRYAGGADWSNLVVRLFGDNGALLADLLHHHCFSNLRDVDPHRKRPGRRAGSRRTLASADGHASASAGRRRYS